MTTFPGSTTGRKGEGIELALSCERGGAANQLSSPKLKGMGKDYSWVHHWKEGGGAATPALFPD